MYRHAIATVSDDRYFPGLWALLNSVHAYYGTDLRVYVFLHGSIPERRRRRLAEHPLGGAITALPTSVLRPTPRGCWEAKQQVFAHLIDKARNVCLLDSDLVLLSPLSDVFADAEKGRIVSCKDGGDLVFGEEYGVYGPRVVGATAPHACTAFVCLDVVRHWDLAALWSFTARFGKHSPDAGEPLEFPGHGDQGLFNGVAALLGKEGALRAHERHEWCNSQAAFAPEDFVEIVGRDGDRLNVRNRATGGRQRLLHCSGPKWWTPEGRRRFAERRDFLACFDHFSRRPRSLDDEPSA